MLLTTPAAAETMVSGQWRALKHLFRWPLAMMLVPTLFEIVLAEVSPNASFAAPWRFYTLFAMLLGLASTVLGLGAVCWSGLWFGLKARSQSSAIAWTVGLTQGLPFVGSVVFPILTMILGRSLGGMRWMAVPGVIMWLPQLVTLLLFVWMIWRAKRNLSQTLAGAEPASFSLRRSVSDATRETVAALRKARHWTP